MRLDINSKKRRKRREKIKREQRASFLNDIHQQAINAERHIEEARGALTRIYTTMDRLYQLENEAYNG